MEGKTTKGIAQMSESTVNSKVKKTRKGAAITALVLGLVSVCGSMIPIINNATIVAGCIGVVFALVALFGTKRVTAVVSLLLCAVGIVVGIVLQVQWGKELDKISSDFPTLSGPTVPAAPAAPSAPDLPPQVAQARDSAQGYLTMRGFSREGLIRQLSSQYGESYPKDVATQAVDSLSVDWNAQAAKAAQSYLDMTSFSCSGLIKQLDSENGDQFTQAQATYGAHQTNACK